MTWHQWEGEEGGVTEQGRGGIRSLSFSGKGKDELVDGNTRTPTSGSGEVGSKKTQPN